MSLKLFTYYREIETILNLAVYAINNVSPFSPCLTYKTCSRKYCHIDRVLNTKYSAFANHFTQNETPVLGEVKCNITGTVYLSTLETILLYSTLPHLRVRVSQFKIGYHIFGTLPLRPPITSCLKAVV
jgi:hypothetical protein